MIKRLLVSGILLSLVACATQKDPIWLNAGEVNMVDYADRNVLVLPVETSPSYRLSRGQEREIQQQVRDMVEDVFELTYINAPDNLRRFGSYPYTLEEVQDLLGAYFVDAAFVVSVFSYQRKDKYSPDTLGIRLAFVDAENPDKAWATTREYVSTLEEQIGSASLDDRMRADMRAVEKALRSGKGFTGFVKTISTFGLWQEPPDDGPRLSVTTETRGSAQIGRQLGGTIDTTQSIYSIIVTAEDEDGVACVAVSNLSTRETEQFEPVPLKDGSLPTIDIMAIDLNLRNGKNTVEIKSVNGEGEPSVRRLVLNRVDNEEIYALGIGIANYDPKEPDPPRYEGLDRQFDDARRRFEGEFFLLQNDEATFREVMYRFDQISDRTAQNEDSVGVFYFSGKTLYDRGRTYLAAYDSEEKYARFTSVPVSLVDLRMRNRVVIMLDLCVDDPYAQNELRQALPFALISFDSCGVHDQKIAARIDELTDRGLSIRAAINTMFEEREQEQLQKF